MYATQGFLNLTGYTLPQVLGRNCRFLQGPDTDPKAVEKVRTKTSKTSLTIIPDPHFALPYRLVSQIRLSIEQGHDMSVCLLNYRVDGTTFWNQVRGCRQAKISKTNDDE